MVEVVALLVKVKTALALPAAFGLNTIENFAEVPAAIVTGSERPLIAKTPELLELAALTVMLEAPAVRVPETELLLPIATLPKFAEAGVSVSVPAGVTPVAERGRETVALEAFDETVTFPVLAPAVDALNDTLKEALCALLSVTGKVIPLTEKPVPLAAMVEIVTLVFPVLVSFTEVVLEEAMTTLPKLTLLTDGESVPLAMPVPETGIANEGLEPFEVMVTEPLKAAVDDGSQVTLKVADWA